MNPESQGPDIAPDTAPVQQEGNLPAGVVPWRVHLRAWLGYSSRDEQNARTVARRGGWSWSELCCQFAKSLDAASLRAFGLAHHEDVKIRDLEIAALKEKLAKEDAA